VIRVVDQSGRERWSAIKGVLLALSARPMGELHAAVQPPRTHRDVRSVSNDVGRESRLPASSQVGLMTR